MIGLFGLEATSATLTVGGDSDTRDLFLFDTPGAQPYGPLVQYSNRTVWILAEPTVSSFFIWFIGVSKAYLRIWMILLRG